MRRPQSGARCQPQAIEEAHVTGGNKAMKIRQMLSSLAAALLVSVTMLGQSLNSSQVSGIVLDPTGASVPGAKVVIKNTDTGLTRTVLSGSAGTYSIPDLPGGPYRLEISTAGFTTYVAQGIKLEVGSNPTFDVHLSVGNITEQVLVTTQSGATVETQSNGIGQVIDSQQVVDLPLNGRDPTQLIALAGATTVAPNSDLNTNKNFPTITISVAGGLPNGIAYSLDGGFHNDIFNNLNLPLPFPDALQEFKVETSSLPAQYGNHASAAVNAVTKSGTNNFHGDAFWFVRNYLFNAANFFGYNTTTQIKQRDSLKRNQFGGVIGGPVIKNKLFFFTGIQQAIVRSNPTNNLVQLATPAEESGDFNEAITCYNATHSTKFSNLPSPYVNNVLPQNLISKFAKAVFAQPIPTGTSACLQSNVPISANSTTREIPAKVDYIINSKQTAFARYFYGKYNLPATVLAQNILTANTVAQTNTDQSLVLGHTWTVTQSLVNAFRVTANRTVGLRTIPSYFNAADVGSNIYQLPALGKYVGLSVTGGIGFGQNPGYFNTALFQFGDDVSLVRGRHQLAFGATYQYGYENTVNNRLSNGSFTFGGTNYGLNVYGYADFLAGAATSFSQSNPDLENDKLKYFAAYAQDTFKLSRHVTLNYGVRFEPYIPFKNTNGRTEHFDMAAFVANVRTTKYSQAPAGLLFSTDPGQPASTYNFGKKNIFEPRIGVIWDPTNNGTMSIRAGYGMFYDPPQLFFDTRYSNSAPYGSSITLTGNLDPTNPYANYAGGNPFPALGLLGTNVQFPLAGVYVNQPLNLKPLNLQQWNLSIQKQLGSWLLGATYLGNTTTHLPTAYEANPAVYIAGNCTAGQYGLTKAGPCSTTNNTQARRLFTQLNPTWGPSYGSVNQYDDGGGANYNGMLVSVQHRGKSVNVTSNYTFAKCLSEGEMIELAGSTYVIPGKRSLSYARCDSDRRPVANLSVILNMPKLAKRSEDHLFGGWGLSTIFTARSGGVATALTGVDNALSGIGGQIATLTGSPYAPASANTRFGASGRLNTVAFAAPPTGTYSLARPYTLTAVGSYALDMSLQRNFRIGESQQFQFRWEVFNVPNAVVFGSPSSTITSTTFGQATTAADPRIMQFALKYIF
jgi:hypothetical protein